MATMPLHRVNKYKTVEQTIAANLTDTIDLTDDTEINECYYLTFINDSTVDLKIRFDAITNDAHTVKANEVFNLSEAKHSKIFISNESLTTAGTYRLWMHGDKLGD